MGARKATGVRIVATLVAIALLVYASFSVVVNFIGEKVDGVYFYE